MPLTKDEIIANLTKQYERMCEITEAKYKQAMEVEESGSSVLNINSRTKKENTDLKEYNNQVNALCRIARDLILVTKSDLPVDKKEDGTYDYGDDELV